MDLRFVHAVQRYQSGWFVGREKSGGEVVGPAGAVEEAGYVRGAAGGALDLGDYFF